MKSILKMFIIISPILGYGFDYSSYEESTLNSILERSDAILNLHQDDKGIEIINPVVRVSLSEELARMPYKCESGFLLKIMKMVRFQIDTFPPINYCVDVKSDSGRTVKFFVQDGLVERIKQEATVGTNISLWALWVYSSGFDGLPRFLMNEFDASPLPNNPSKKDAVNRASS